MLVQDKDARVVMVSGNDGTDTDTDGSSTVSEDGDNNVQSPSERKKKARERLQAAKQQRARATKQAEAKRAQQAKANARNAKSNTKPPPHNPTAQQGNRQGSGEPASVADCDFSKDAKWCKSAPATKYIDGKENPGCVACCAKLLLR